MQISNDDELARVLKEIFNVISFRAVPISKYPEILLARYRAHQKRNEQLPEDVPDCLVEGVRKYVQSTPDYNLRGCVNALDKGIERYLKK